MAALDKRWREAREDAGFSCNALDKTIGAATGTSSRIERAEYENPSLDKVVKAAQTLGVSPAWLAFGTGSKAPGPTIDRFAELPAVAFISKIGRMQKLVSTIESHPEKGWKLWQVAAVVQDHLDTPTLATAEGDPIRGSWADVLDEKAGRTPPAKVVGGVDRVRASHRREHTRKRKPK